MEPYSANKLMLKNTLALVGDRGIVEEGRSEKEKKKRKRGKEMEKPHLVQTLLLIAWVLLRWIV
jgi:hypothetical protein